jgi:hypothetical protein
VLAHGHEGAGGIGRDPAEGGAVLGQEPFAQVAIGGGQRRDAGHAELVDQAALQSAVGGSLRPRAWGE